MKKNLAIFVLFLFQQFVNAQLSNQGFELTAPGSYTTANAVSGWTVESRKATSTCSYTNWAPGSPEFSIVATPLFSWPITGSPITFVPPSPLGGNNVAQLNNASADTIMTRLKQTVVVTSTNSLFVYTYAGVWQNGAANHGCCQMPGFKVNFYDCNGSVLTCNSYSLFPGNGCQSAGATYSYSSNGPWSNWQTKYVDLTPFLGSCITIEFITTDCSLGCHWGTTLFDYWTGPHNLYPGSSDYFPHPTGPIVFCPSNSAIILGPVGYYLYQWISPNGPVAAPQGTLPTLYITNPSPGSVYTLNVSSYYNCTYNITYTLNYTAAAIKNIGSSPSCSQGAAGSATVVAAGSSVGYNYSWIDNLNNVVSTQSVASGLSPGVYSVTVGTPSNNCGTATATIAVGIQTPTLKYNVHSHCGIAYIPTPSGANNIKWFGAGGTPITGTAGTAPTLTVSNPCNGCTYISAYDLPSGCRDSVMHILNHVIPGSVNVPTAGIRPNCTSVSNGSAAITIAATAQTTAGLNMFYISSTGTTSPFTASTGPTSSTVFPISNLPAGNYSVNAFDGLCAYTTTFAINPVSFSFSVNITKDTVCVGSSGSAIVTFSNPPGLWQYSYSWSPTTWLFSSSQQINATFFPTNIPQGSAISTIYTVMVTPSVAPCPQTKTIAVTAANPTVYSIAVPPGPLCDISSSQVLTVQPTGGSFLNSTLSPGLVDNAGIISPSNAIAGINTFTYEVNIGPCRASKSSTVLVSHFVPAQLTSNALQRCIDSPPFDLQSIQSNSNAGAWSGPGVQNNLFSINTLQPGAYTLTYNTWSHPDPAACPDTTLLPATVALLPPVSASSGSVCAGENFTISSSGAYSYSYSSGSGVVKPSANTSYSIWGLSVEGCKSPSAAVINVSVVPSPTLNITSTNTLICEGDTVILSASGASTYSWNNGPASPVFSVNPAFTTMYILTGTLGECKATAYYLQNVSPCTSLSERKEEAQILVFPNPFSEVIYLQTSNIDKNSLLEITDNSGRVLLQMPLKSELNSIQLGQLPKGLYHLRVSSKESGVRSIKMIKQ